MTYRLKIQERPGKLPGFRIDVTNRGYAYTCLTCEATFLPEDERLPKHFESHLEESRKRLPVVGQVFLNNPTSGLRLVLETNVTERKGLLDFMVARFRNKVQNRPEPNTVGFWDVLVEPQRLISENWEEIAHIELRDGIGTIFFEVGWLMGGAVKVKLATTGRAFTFDNVTYAEVTRQSDFWWLPYSLISLATKSPTVHRYSLSRLGNQTFYYKGDPNAKIRPADLIGMTGEPLYFVDFKNQQWSNTDFITESDLVALIEGTE